MIREGNRESKRKRKGREDHYWEIALTHVSKFKRGKWVRNSKAPYQKYLFRVKNAKNKCADIVRVI